MWSFRYKVYPKQRAIQFKPYHDKTNHFSIVWGNKKEFSENDFITIEQRVREYLVSHNWTLTFTILRACTNCTYGRFDPEFEELILQLRRDYPFLSRKKDLTLGDPKHTDLHQKVVWDEEHPIIHHVHGRSETGDAEIDKQWEQLFRGPSTAAEIAKGLLFGTKVVLEITA